MNAISAVQSRGDFWYEIYTERLNATRFLELLQRFVRGRSPVFLILDGHPAHRASSSRSTFALRGRLELHFLRLAPELNPRRVRLDPSSAKASSKKPLRRDDVAQRVARSCAISRAALGDRQAVR